jgi:hypothetical protein
MATEKLDPVFDDTNSSPINDTPTAPRSTGTVDPVKNSGCCAGMSCRKKILIGVAIAIFLIGIIAAIAACMRHCECGEKK